MTTETLHNKFLQCTGVSTDTRSITVDQLFFCLQGPNFNANALAQKALEAGAKYVVLDDEKYYQADNEQHILVEDSLVALQELANYHRNYVKPIIISMTGSNGKTTTKELIHAVLKEKFDTIATIGNLNNHIGVPLTLLRLTKDTQIGIVEMGANHQKEIESLCKIAQPDFGYITNFGKAHLEGFGGIDGVIKGKSELYDYLQSTNKKAFVRYDDPIQFEKSKAFDHISFSFDVNDRAEFHFTSGKNDGLISIKYNQTEIHSNLSGIYNLPNIAAAITIGLYFSIEIDKIKHAIEHYYPTNNRSQWMKFGTNDILMDAYNANPSSMKVSIENFTVLDMKNKIMVLGDMFELGEYSDIEHQNIIQQVVDSKIKCYFIGNHFFANKKEDQQLNFYPTYEEFAENFSINDLNEATVLIKGSRGMALERTIK